MAYEVTVTQEISNIVGKKTKTIQNLVWVDGCLTIGSYLLPREQIILIKEI